jgi:hypothetical protein
MAYYVVYAPDNIVTAISVFNNYAGAEEANRRALAWIEQDLAPLLVGPRRGSVSLAANVPTPDSCQRTVLKGIE